MDRVVEFNGKRPRIQFTRRSGFYYGGAHYRQSVSSNYGNTIFWTTLWLMNIKLARGDETQRRRGNSRLNAALCRGVGTGWDRVEKEAKGREGTAEIRVQKLSDGRCGHWRWTWTNFLESNKLKAENG